MTEDSENGENGEVVDLAGPIPITLTSKNFNRRHER